MKNSITKTKNAHIFKISIDKDIQFYHSKKGKIQPHAFVNAQVKPMRRKKKPMRLISIWSSTIQVRVWLCGVHERDETIVGVGGYLYHFSYDYFSKYKKFVGTKKKKLQWKYSYIYKNKLEMKKTFIPIQL